MGRWSDSDNAKLAQLFCTGKLNSSKIDTDVTKKASMIPITFKMPMNLTAILPHPKGYGFPAHLQEDNKEVGVETTGATIDKEDVEVAKSLLESSVLLFPF